MLPDPSPSSLFARLLGASFSELPASIREIHRGHPSIVVDGACSIERGGNWLAQLSATIAGMPPAAAEVPLRVEIVADAAGETWSRYFGDRLMCSRMRGQGNLLVERLGPLTIAFRLEADPRQIRWIPQSGRVLGIPMPASVFKGIVATEYTANDRYHFEVRAALPVMGLVIHYRGWLFMPESLPAQG